MSGWWSIASASLATRLTNSIALLKFSNFKSRVSQSPSRLQSARRARASWICSSFSFIYILLRKIPGSAAHPWAPGFRRGPTDRTPPPRDGRRSQGIYRTYNNYKSYKSHSIGKTNNQIRANVRTRNAACTMQRVLYRLTHQIAEMKGPPYSIHIEDTAQGDTP